MKSLAVFLAVLALALTLTVGVIVASMPPVLLTQEQAVAKVAEAICARVFECVPEAKEGWGTVEACAAEVAKIGCQDPACVGLVPSNDLVDQCVKATRTEPCEAILAGLSPRSCNEVLPK